MPDEGLILVATPRPSSWRCAIIALGFTSMMFGLIISALVKTAEKTMPLLVMFAIVQVVFTGVPLPALRHARASTSSPG